MAQNTQFLILGILSFGSIAFYGRMVLAMSRMPMDRIKTASYATGDIFGAGLLVLWLLSIIWSSVSRTAAQAVTMELLVASGVLSLFLCLGVVGFLALRKISPLEMFGLRWKKWKSGLLVIVMALAAAYPAILLAQAISYHFFGPDTAPQEILLFVQTHSAFSDRLAVIVLAVLIAPLTEEIIFRGYLHGVLRKYGGPWCAVFVTAMLFSAIHGHAASLAGLFLLGVALSLVYEFTTSLWAPFLMHACFNAITVVIAVNWPDYLA